MYKVGQFEKVSLTEFNNALQKLIKEQKYVLTQDVRLIYNNLKLPSRATRGSAGYDFHSSIPIKLYYNKSIQILTGIRVKIKEGWLLSCYPRSSLGIKFKLQLDNTVAIIDSDYYSSDNQGHIILNITNNSNTHKILNLSLNDRFMQGIFLPYGITCDDDVHVIRNGGIGSTDKRVCKIK